jgi:hypothetical protein
VPHYAVLVAVSIHTISYSSEETISIISHEVDVLVRANSILPFLVLLISLLNLVRLELIPSFYISLNLLVDLTDFSLSGSNQFFFDLSSSLRFAFVFSELVIEPSGLD